MNRQRILEPEIIVFVVAIVAILVWGAIVVLKMVIAHRERMAMIERGLHPDYPPDDEDSEPDVGP